MTPGDSAPPRRTGFALLWTSQMFSEFAYSTSLIVLPLLLLAITRSPAQAGVVGFTDAAAMLLAGLPAGAVSDRYDRRTVMLCCESVLVMVFGGLALLLWAGAASLPVFVVLALANGAATATMMAAGEAMVPDLVPEERLSSAVAMNSARTYGGQLAGTSAGGFLLAVRNVFPFVVGCAAHLAGLVLLLFMERQPPVPPAPRRGGAAGGARELTEGIRWIAGHPFLRLGFGYATATNFFFSAVYFVVIASAQRSGMSSGLIGLMAGLLGVGGLLGALAAPALRKALTGSRPIFVVLWLLSVLTAGMAVLPGSYTPGVLLGVIGFSAPTANAYFTTYQLLLTPASHRGRVVSAAAICSGAGGAVAPLAGGLLLDLVGRYAGLLACSAVMAVIALSAVLSPVMRQVPEPEPASDEREPAPVGPLSGSSRD
jgi:MFS family permease